MRISAAGSKANPYPPPAKRRRGFTLIELLVVLAIMGILTTAVALTISHSPRHAATAEIRQLSLLLEAAMIGVFVALDLFLFYIFWEVVLVPMYFLIGVWGSDRRLIKQLEREVKQLAKTLQAVQPEAMRLLPPPRRRPEDDDRNAESTR